MAKTKKREEGTEKPKLTPKQKKFADTYLETGKVRESYAIAYESKGKKETQEVNASRILRKDQVQAYLADHVEMARSVIVEIAQSKKSKDNDRLQAAKDILDRTEGKPVQRQINANTDTDKQYRWAE